MADVVSMRGEPVLSPGVADPDVVGALEKYLEMAKSGEMVAFALAYQYRDGTTGTRRVGAGNNRTLIGTLEALKHAMLST